LADAASAAGQAAEALGVEDAGFKAAHEAAARKYVAAAKRVRDPVTRRAVALVGHAHAQKASEEGRLPSQRQKPQAAASSPSNVTPSSSLCVGDLLALERRLHQLGAKGVTRKHSKRAQVRRDETAADLVVAYVGEAYGDDEAYDDSSSASAAAAAAAAKEEEEEEDTAAKEAASSREESLARSLKRLSDENARLRKALDDVETREAAAAATEVKLAEFQAAYQKKFDALKKALDELWKRHPETPTSKTYAQLEAELSALEKQLKTEQEFSRKKDAVIERYEHWYRALKDSANKRKLQLKKEQSSGSSDGAGSRSASFAAPPAAAVRSPGDDPPTTPSGPTPSSSDPGSAASSSR